MTPDQYTELVLFLGRKFDGIDREFEQVRRHATALFEQARDERRLMMEGIDARFEAVDARFEAVDARFGTVDRRFDHMGGRIDAVETALRSLDGSVRGTLADHERRLEALEDS